MSKKSEQKYNKILSRRKQKIERRLGRKQWEKQDRPMFRARNIHYEIAERNQAINCGGIGAIHQMVLKCGLVKEIDEKLELLKMHMPYHESDHVLNIAYNVLSGNIRLEDIELNRQDEGYLNAVGAQRIPDPTTAGDFTRRFRREDILKLMECINTGRLRVWKEARKEILEEALVDIDGTIAKTYGGCKEGMDISYKGIWGYAPLIISLWNTKEVLYLVNRPGNKPSHDGCVEWVDRAIGLVKPYARRICVRGDTDFSLTENFDRWSREVDFVFGMDAHKVLVRHAEELPGKAWRVLSRKPKYRVKTKERSKPEKVKERIVKEREYKDIRLASEHVSEFEYRPMKCKQSYRVIVLMKNLSVEKGEKVLLDDIRYFFYITTRRDMTAEELVELANGRCDQENVVEQLKNGVNAMKMPVRDLESNWAYMVMAALAWNLKSWFGLLMPNAVRGMQVQKMEFRRFLNTLILLPCQILKTGRKIVYRILRYNDWLKDFFATWERIRRLKMCMRE
ncbi:MAG: IS1380 family transposase [Candidatus Brocadiaceae baterium WH-1]|nr:MAG: IS1380 family transposase [Candidatus Jettenia sp. AMX2]WKZ22707.1 MAG: IS1380 family transposase [Candidatus Jettenia sp. AMX2]WKZ22708.1 MAG: IS1380 family transposase [Candidatus Jettenia sp. AMX2]